MRDKRKKKIDQVSYRVNRTVVVKHWFLKTMGVCQYECYNIKFVINEEY